MSRKPGKRRLQKKVFLLPQKITPGLLKAYKAKGVIVKAERRLPRKITSEQVQLWKRELQSQKPLELVHALIWAGARQVRELFPLVNKAVRHKRLDVRCTAIEALLGGFVSPKGVKPALAFLRESRVRSVLREKIVRLFLNPKLLKKLSLKELEEVVAVFRPLRRYKDRDLVETVNDALYALNRELAERRRFRIT